MVSIRVSVAHVPLAAGMGVEIRHVRDQAERARVRHGCMLYSPDGMALATKGGDGTLNIWIALLGICYCTLSSHIAPITDVTFSLNDRPAQFVSLAIDSTIRAHDLHQYTNFRTLTSPDGPAQSVH